MIDTRHVIHPELAAVFDEHAKPTHCCHTRAGETIAPAVDIAALTLLQVAEYRRRLLAAENAPHNPIIEPKLEFAHRTLDGLDQLAATFVANGRALRNGFANLDKILRDAKSDLEAHAAANPPESA